jgi:signal peptidase II
MTSKAQYPKQLLAWVLAAFVVVLDQITKQLAVSRLADGAVDVIWTLRFRLTYNSGMAFGAGSSLGPLIAIGAFVVVMFLAKSISGQPRLVNQVAVGVLVGGAIGNLVDRLFRSPGFLRGAVVDFIDFGWFPVFNVADIAINVGAALLILSVLTDSRRGRLSEGDADAG